MNSLLNFIRKYYITFIGLILILFITGAIEFYSGRLLLGPDGKFGLWSGNIWSSENSQRFADAYSFAHVLHGIILYAFLWLIARHLPVRYRFLIALVLEAGWELLENSPIIINRYREVTISLGYVGDSVLNSVSDILMAGLGFIIARGAKIWVTILIIIVFEIGCLIWVRDNLATNIIMLIHPIESLREWQSGDHP